MPWFSFTPPGTGTPDPSNPNQYTLVGANPPSCPENEKVCAIQASNSTGNQPVITTALLQEITRALQNETESANVLLKADTL